MEPSDKKQKNSIALKVAVEHYLKAMGLDRKMLEASVLVAWPEIMGDAVAQRTESKTIRNQTLYLKINSSVMRNELFQMRSVIVKRINEKAGFEIITEVYFE